MSVSKSSDRPYFDLPHPWIHNQTDPYAIASGVGWYVAPHGKVLGWIQQYDEYPPDGWEIVHLFGVWSHGVDDQGRRVWLASRVGSSPAFDLATFPIIADQSLAKKFKGTRWVLLKNPENLTEKQQVTLEQMRQDGGLLWQAYQLKESLREVFAGDLAPAEVMEMIISWCQLAAASGIPKFAKAAATNAYPHPRHPRRRHPGTIQRPARRPEQQDPHHDQALLRIPQPTSGPGPHHARLRTPSKPSSDITDNTTHTHVRRAEISRPARTTPLQAAS